MKKSLLAGGLSAALILGCAGATWADDAASQSQLERRQADAAPGLRRAVADAAGYQLTDIDARVSAHVVTITVVNGRLNTARNNERKDEASVISAAVARAIAAKPEFSDIMMIHVDYVKRQGNHDDVIQGFDFNKNPAGGFSAHVT